MILVVEDEPAVRQIAELSLEANGYSVVGAESSASAVEVFSQHKDSIDLVLLDVILPDGNGPETADRILAVRPDVKVMFMTGYSPEVAPARDDKRFSFLEKPFTPDRLVTAVRECLQTCV